MARDETNDPTAEQPEPGGPGGVRPDGAEQRPGPDAPESDDATQTEWRPGELGSDEPQDDKTRTASGIVLPTERKKQGPEEEDEEGAVRDPTKWQSDGATLTEFEAGGDEQEASVEQLGVEHEPWFEDGPTQTGFDSGDETDDEVAPPELQEVGPADLPWLEDGPTLTGFEIGEEEAQPFEPVEPPFVANEEEQPDDKTRTASGVVLPSERKQQGPEEQDEDGAVREPTDWQSDGATLTEFEAGGDEQEAPVEQLGAIEHEPWFEDGPTQTGFDSGDETDDEVAPPELQEVGPADLPWLEDGPTLTGFELGEEEAPPFDPSDQRTDDKTRAASGIVLPSERKQQGPEEQDEDGAVRDTDREENQQAEEPELIEALEPEPDPEEPPVVAEGDESWVADGPTLSGFEIGDEDSDDKTRTASGVVLPSERKQQGPEEQDEDGAVRDIDREEEHEPWLEDGPTRTGFEIGEEEPSGEQSDDKTRAASGIVLSSERKQQGPEEQDEDGAVRDTDRVDEEDSRLADEGTAAAFGPAIPAETEPDEPSLSDEGTAAAFDPPWADAGPTSTGAHIGEDATSSEADIVYLAPTGPAEPPPPDTPVEIGADGEDEWPDDGDTADALDLEGTGEAPELVEGTVPEDDASWIEDGPTLTGFALGEGCDESDDEPSAPLFVGSDELPGEPDATQTDVLRSLIQETDPSGQPASREESDPTRTEPQTPHSPDPTGAGSEQGADQGVAVDEHAATHSFPAAADAGTPDATRTDLFGPARDLPPLAHTPVSPDSETDSDPLRDSMPVHVPPKAPEPEDDDRTATDVGIDDDGMPEGTQTASHEFGPNDENDDLTRTMDEAVVPPRESTRRDEDETVSVFETFGQPVRVPDEFAAEAPEEPERPKAPPKAPKRSRRRFAGADRRSLRETVAYLLHLLLTVLRREAQQGDEAIRGVMAGLRSRFGRGGLLGTGLRLRDLWTGFGSVAEGDAKLHSILEAAVGEGSFLGQHVRPRELWAWLRRKIPTLSDMGRARRKSLEAIRETIRLHTDLKAAKNAKWWRKTLVEIGSLFAIVVPIEMALNKGAVGSFGFHPHPYWLIVLPMAGARGVVAGLISAGVASLLYVIGAHGALRSEEQDFWTISNLLEPVLFFGVGFFLGELHDELAARYRKLEQRIEDVQERIARLRRERDVLGDANKELEKRIVDDSVQFGNLIVAATRIENADRKEVFDIALELVEEHCGASASVLIRLEDDSLDFLCHRGWSGEETSDRLAAARKSEFVARAVAEGRVVNGFQPEEQAPEDGPLVVAPLFDATGVVKALLCLDEIPATRLNESSIRVFLGIADWISSALARLAQGHDAPDPRRAMGAMAPNAEMALGSPEELGDRMRLELERCARYGVPTSLLTIHAVEWTDATPEGLDNLDRFMLTHFTSGLRPSDTLYHFGYPGCYLLVLAGTSTDGAEVVRNRMIRRLDYAPSRSVGEIEIKTSGPDAEAPDLESLVERVAGELREASPLPLEGRCPVRVPERSEPGELLEFVRRIKMETSLAVRNGFDLHVVGIQADLDDRDLESGLLARHVNEIGLEILRPTDGIYTIGPRHCAVILPCTDGEAAAMVAHRIVTGLRDRDAHAPYGDLETRVMGLGPSNPDAGSFLRAFSAASAEGNES